MDHRSQSGSKRDLVPATILAIIIAYTITLCIGWPQTGTQKIASQLTEHEARNSPATVETMVVAPPFWTVLPFVLLLAGIAVLPLISHTSHWWESNLNRFKVAGGLALATMAYYAFLHNGGLEGHWPALHTVAPSEGSVQTGLVNTILANAMLEEFIPFIVLLFSLYTISGGIRIACDFEARPTTNAIFMGVGAVLASLIGTTGAAMLLIRPLLETNRERKHVAHTVVFFIFIVCNCGGCLLPIGDPPLFLGYLEGVPFLWTLRLWPEWLFVNGLLIVTYLLLDSLWFHRRETPADIQRDIRTFHRLRIAGWQLNAPLLLGIVLAVALLDPGKTFPGTAWHPWMYLREIVQLCLVGVSLRFGTNTCATPTCSHTARSSRSRPCSSASSSACNRLCKYSASKEASWALQLRLTSFGLPAVSRAYSTTRPLTWCFSRRLNRCHLIPSSRQSPPLIQ